MSHSTCENNEEIINDRKSKKLENEQNVRSKEHIIVPECANVKKNDLSQEDSYLKLKNKKRHQETSNTDQILNQELLYLIKKTRESNLKTDYSDDFFATLEDIATKLNNLPIPSSEIPEKRMNSEEKSRELIKAEREAKKAAKAAAKNKNKEKLDTKTDKLIVDDASKVKNTDNNAIPKETKLKSKDIKIVSKESKPLKEAKSPKETKSPKESKSSKESNSSKESVVKSNFSLDSITTVFEDIRKELDKIQIEQSEKPIEEIAKAPEEKSKAQLRAERRAKQEAQRAAKQEQVDKKKQKTVEPKVATQSKVPEPVKKVVAPKPTVKDNSHRVNLFKHLHHERDIASCSLSDLDSKIHPEIVKLGVKYANKIIVGSNARCVAFLQSVKHLVEDFERPSQADFTRGLEVSLQESAVYLDHCRPSAVSMQNALKHLKWQMSLLPATISDEEVNILFLF